MKGLSGTKRPPSRPSHPLHVAKCRPHPQDTNRNAAATRSYFCFLCSSPSPCLFISLAVSFQRHNRYRYSYSLLPFRSAARTPTAQAFLPVSSFLRYTFISFHWNIGANLHSMFSGFSIFKWLRRSASLEDALVTAMRAAEAASNLRYSACFGADAAPAPFPLAVVTAQAIAHCLLEGGARSGLTLDQLAHAAPPPGPPPPLSLLAHYLAGLGPLVLRVSPALLVALQSNSWGERLSQQQLLLQSWVCDTRLLRRVAHRLREEEEAPTAHSACALAGPWPPNYIPVTQLAAELRRRGDWAGFEALCSAWLGGEAAAPSLGVEWRCRESRACIRRRSNKPVSASWTAADVSPAMQHVMTGVAALLVPRFYVRTAALTDRLYAEARHRFAAEWLQLPTTQAEGGGQSLWQQFTAAFPTVPSLLAHPALHAVVQRYEHPTWTPTSPNGAATEEWVRLHPLLQHPSAGRGDAHFAPASVEAQPPQEALPEVSFKPTSPPLAADVVADQITNAAKARPPAPAPTAVPSRGNIEHPKLEVATKMPATGVAPGAVPGPVGAAHNTVSASVAQADESEDDESEDDDEADEDNEFLVSLLREAGERDLPTLSSPTPSSPTPSSPTPPSPPPFHVSPTASVFEEYKKVKKPYVRRGAAPQRGPDAPIKADTPTPDGPFRFTPRGACLGRTSTNMKAPSSSFANRPWELDDGHYSQAKLHILLTVIQMCMIRVSLLFFSFFFLRMNFSIFDQLYFSFSALALGSETDDCFTDPLTFCAAQLCHSCMLKQYSTTTGTVEVCLPPFAHYCTGMERRRNGAVVPTKKSARPSKSQGKTAPPTGALPCRWGRVLAVPLAVALLSTALLQAVSASTNYAADDATSGGESESSTSAKQWTFLILTDAVLLLFAALFAGLTLALVGLDTLSLEIIADSGKEPDKSYAQKILPIRQLGNQLLCTLILGNVMVNTLIAQITDEHMHGWVATIVSTALTTLGGEVIPQAVMSAHALKVGSKSAPIVKFFIVLFYPVSKPCSVLLDWAIGEDPGQIYERSELKKLMFMHAARSAETGIGEGEVDLMVGAMELHEKTVLEVMTPISEVLMLEANERLNEDTIQLISERGHSRIPVYQTNKNNIIGVLFAKDLLMVDPQENTKVILLVKFYNRRCHVVPSETKLISMLKYFQTGRTHIALVKEVQQRRSGDPYYEIKGLLTMEDVIEELIHSEIFDEYDVDPQSLLSPDLNATFSGALPRIRQVGLTSKSSRRVNLSENELTACALFLSKSFPELSGARELANSVKRHATVHSVRAPKDARGLDMEDRQNIWLYRAGVPTATFTLVLAGKVEAFVGAEEVAVEMGNWSMLARDAISCGNAPDGSERPQWIPHFSCRVVHNSTLLQITRDAFERICAECHTAELLGTEDVQAREEEREHRSSFGVFFTTKYRSIRRWLHEDDDDDLFMAECDSTQAHRSRAAALAEVSHRVDSLAGSMDVRSTGAAGFSLSATELQDMLNSGEADEAEVIELLTSAAAGEGEANMAQQYEQQQQAVEEACEAYILAHVSDAERIAKLYREYSACEARILDFEKEILSFQLRLRDAEDLVTMQQQIESLLLRVKHRQQVSASINEVYSALQECDAFCQSIASNHPIDEKYLGNLRRLGVKLTFLSRHKALQHSAVGDEIRPKLTMAAEHAGERLYRYLAGRIQQMPTGLDPTPTPQGGAAAGIATSLKAMEALHASMEETDSFGFTFLKLYNPPVAKRIVILYVQSAAAFYGNLFKVAAEQFRAARPETSDGVKAVSPQDAQADVERWLAGTPGTGERHPLETALQTSEGLAYIQVLNAISLKYGNLHFVRPKTVTPRSSPDVMWLSAFIEYFLLVVNACTGECRFVGNFFCVAETPDGAEENYSDAERVSRLLLGPLIHGVQSTVEERLTDVRHRLQGLAALRVLQLCKEHVCTSQDPIPLLLLCGLLEVCKAVLRSNVQRSLQSDAAATERCTAAITSGVTSGPHGATSPPSLREPNGLWGRVAEMWAVDALNTAQLTCSAFGAVPKSCDTSVDKALAAAARQVCDTLAHLARHVPSQPGYLVLALHQFRHAMQHRLVGTAVRPTPSCGGAAKRVLDEAFGRSVVCFTEAKGCCPALCAVLTWAANAPPAPPSSGAAREEDAAGLGSIAARLCAVWETEMDCLKASVAQLRSEGAAAQLCYSSAFNTEVLGTVADALAGLLQRFPKAFTTPSRISESNDDEEAGAGKGSAEARTALTAEAVRALLLPDRTDPPPT
eukprot:gene7291-5133_t